MKFLLAKKQNMTQLFDEQGVVTPVTVLKAGPVTVTQIKNAERDGYAAVQVGFDTVEERKLAKPQIGHLKGKGLFRVLKEFAMPAEEITANEGDILDVSTFAAGDVVEISSTSKGKGFQGVVKRHGFGGGRRSHGQKHSEREAGSIGGGGRAGGRVAKGMRMAGRMGSDRVTIKNVKIVAVDAEKGEMYIKGAIPGIPGAVVEIRS